MNSFSKILVTGGAGFIGSYIVDELLKSDVNVIALDNLYTGKMENVVKHQRNRNFQFIKGDVRNLDLIKSTLKEVDAVFNEAAVVGIPRSKENPILANEVNVNGTLNLLEACLNTGVKRFVQASSASVYGDTETLALAETLPAKPISPYAVSEYSAESYARVYWKIYGLETVCLRYFNVYGPRQTYSIYSGVTTIFVHRLLEDKPPVVFGDGEQTRDFVYVKDAVAANMLALSKREATGEVFNVGTGTETTINNVVEFLLEIMGKSSCKPVYEAPRTGDIKHSCANINKTTEILGYKPSISIKEGLTKLVMWYKHQRESCSNPF